MIKMKTYQIIVVCLLIMGTLIGLSSFFGFLFWMGSGRHDIGILCVGGFGIGLISYMFLRGLIEEGWITFKMKEVN